MIVFVEALKREALKRARGVSRFNAATRQRITNYFGPC